MLMLSVYMSTACVSTRYVTLIMVTPWGMCYESVYSHPFISLLYETYNTVKFITRALNNIRLMNRFIYVVRLACVNTLNFKMCNKVLNYPRIACYIL